ncbi:MAG: DUF1761 domain-containing protein [Pseudomonadota bacterium]
MMEITTGVNWLAVIVGTVAAFIAGWAWYSPKLMGQKWADGSNVTINSADNMPIDAMAAQFIGLFLISWFVSLMAANDKLLTVILVTLGFIVLAWSGSAFAKQNTTARNINAGYWIIAVVIMILANAMF